MKKPSVTAPIQNAVERRAQVVDRGTIPASLPNPVDGFYPSPGMRAMPEPPPAPPPGEAPPPFEMKSIEELEELHKDGLIQLGGFAGTVFDLRLAQKKILVEIRPMEAERLLGCFRNFVPDPEKMALFKKHYRENAVDHEAITREKPILIGPHGEIRDGWNRLANIVQCGQMRCYVAFEGRESLPPTQRSQFEKLVKQFADADNQWRAVHTHLFILPSRMPEDFLSCISDDDRMALREIWRAGKAVLRDIQKYEASRVGEEHIRQKEALIANPTTAPQAQSLEEIRQTFFQRRVAIVAAHSRTALKDYLPIAKAGIKRLLAMIEKEITQEAAHDLAQANRFGLPFPYADMTTRSLLAAHHKVCQARDAIAGISLNSTNFFTPDRDLMKLFGVEEPTD